MRQGNRSARLTCTALAAGAVAIAVWPSGAARGVAPPPGTLTIAWTWLGCVGAAGPCTPAAALRFPKWLAPAEDGRTIYVSAQNGDAVVALTRDATTGSVQPGACAIDDGATGASPCTPVPALDGPQGLAVAPGGANVYVTANVSHAVGVLRRDSATGALSTVQCLADAAHPDAACTPVPGLAGAANAAVSPAGDDVYVAAVDSNALTSYRRDPVTGALTQTGCFADPSVTIPDCAPAAGLKQAFAVTLDPDGENVYVAARGSSAITSFARNPATGLLTPLGCLSGDRGYRQDPACAPAIGMQYVQFVAPSPDGNQIYASATDSHAIGVFERGPDGNLTQAAMPDGCVQDIGYEPATPCRPAVGLALPLGIAFTPDGRDAYVAEFGYGTLTGYERDPATGALSQVAGCLGNDPRCEPHGTLQRAGSVALVGDQLLVTAAGSDAVNVLRPGRAVATATPTPAPTSTPTPEPPRVPRLRVSLVVPSSQGLGRVLRRGIRVRMLCTRACAVSASITVSRRAAVRHRLVRPRARSGPPVPIASLHTNLPARRTLRLRIPLAPRAAARLARTRRIAVRVRVTATDDEQHQSRTATRRTLLVRHIRQGHHR